MHRPSTAQRPFKLPAVILSGFFMACSIEDAGVSAPDACAGDGCQGAVAVSLLDAGTALPLGVPDAAASPAGHAASAVLPCDVDALLAKYCRTCHVAGGSAPMKLIQPADFAAMSPSDTTRRVLQTTQERLHTADTKRAMPPAGYAKPSSDEVALLDAWLAAGSPAGIACGNAVQPVPQVAAPDAGTVEPDNLECFKFLAHDASSKDVKFNVGIALDTYVNMTFVPQWAETRYAVSVKPVVDNAKVLHHWLLFRNSTPGPDGLVAPDIGAHPDGDLITAWAPGGDGLDLSNLANVGYEMPGGSSTSYTLEFHYNSSDPGAQDASGVEICMFKRKPANTASVSWLGKDNLVVPDTKWVATCDPLTDEPIHIVSVMPHMHTSGVHMKATINRANGKTETLHDEDFNFEYQKSYPKDVTLLAGDSITTECTYSKPTLFGKATDQEMCYLFTYAYPAGALVQIDPWGAFAHGGNSCLQ
jgi:hypothetical protein